MILNGGLVQLSGGNDQIYDGNVLSISGGTFDLNGQSETVGGFTGTGGTILNNNNGTNVTITIGGGAGAPNTSGGNYSGSLTDHTSGTGTLALTKTGTGSQTLSGVNSYTGATNITGFLQFGKQVSLYNNNTAGAGWTATNIVVNSGATLALNVGGTGEFTAADVGTLTALGTAAGGFKSGSILGLDTTDNTSGVFSDATVLANPNSGANVLGLNKLGTGTLTLNAGNTYSGGTTVTAGLLDINANGTGAATPIGTGALTLVGGGLINSSGAPITLATNPAVTLGGSFVFGSNTSTSANNLNLGTGAVTDSGNRTIAFAGTGTTLTLGGVLTNTFGAAQTTTVNGAGNTLVLGGYALSNSATSYADVINGSGNVTITGPVTDGGTATASGLNYGGTGTLTLSGTNTYRGATVTNSGTTLLDFTGSNTGATRLAATSTLTLSGGTFKVLGTDVAGQTTVQTVASTAVSASSTNLVVAKGGANLDLVVLNLGAISRTAPGTLDVTQPAGTISATNGVTTTTANNAAGILGGYATVGGSDWAVSGASGTNPITAFSTYTAMPAAGVTAANTNYLQTSATAVTTLTGGLTVNSLKIANGGTGQSLALGANNVTFSGASGGLLYVGGNDNLYTISGTGIIGAGTTNEFIVNAKSGTTLTISAPIISTTATAGTLTKTGAGTLILSATNSAYTGATTIVGGTVSIAANTNLGATTTPITLNGGTLRTTTGFTDTHVITVGAAGGTIDTSNVQLYLNTAGLLTGSGPLNVIGTSLGSLRLGQANAGFTGSTTIGATVLIEDQNPTGLGSSAVTVNTGGELVASNVALANNVTVNGGTLSFDNGNLGVFSGTVSLGTAGSTVALRDWYATATARSGSITNVISGAGGLFINSGTGAGGAVLTLSGANTYTGVTDINKTVVNVASLSDYGLASSLGARTQAQETATGDGIGIHLLNGTLQYTGSTPQSTNREIRLINGATGGTIDASGTGAGTLSFTHTGANTNLFDTSGTRTLTLTGSNTGANTFAITLTDQAANATSLTKTGAGQWVISGANTYTGVTTISGGTLSIPTIDNVANANPLGKSSVASTNLVFNGGTLNFTGASGSTDRGFALTGAGTISFPAGNNNTLAFGGAVTGAGLFTVDGQGSVGYQNVLTLSGNNSAFTGSVNINVGALKITNSNGLGTGTKTITTSNGTSGHPTLQLDGSGGDITLPSTFTYAVSNQNDSGSFLNLGGNNTVAGLVNIGTGGGGFLATSSGGNLNLSANITAIAAGRGTFLQGTSTGTVSGIISNGSTVDLFVDKAGTGTWTYTGANTYSGRTGIFAGTLSVASINSVSGGGTTSNLGHPITVSNGTITLGGLDGNLAGFGAITSTGTLKYTGTGETTDRVLNLNGTTGGGVVDQSGTGLLKFTSALTATGAGSKALTLQGSTAGAGEIAGAIVDNSVGKTTSVVKAGTGTWTLSGANSYTGATTVTAGALAVSGSISGTTVVNNSGTLLLNSSTNANNIVGNGTAAPVSSNQTIAGSVGTTTYTGTNGSTLRVGNTNPGGVTNSFASLTLSGASTLDFASNNTNNNFIFGTLDPATAAALTAGTSTLNIANWSGTVYDPSATQDTGTFGDNQSRLLFATDPGFAANTAISGITFDGSLPGMEVSFGTQYEIVPIPEPSTIYSGLLILGLAGYRERRRLRKLLPGLN